MHDVRDVGVLFRVRGPVVSRDVKACLLLALGRLPAGCSQHRLILVLVVVGSSACVVVDVDLSTWASLGREVSDGVWHRG